MKDGYIEGQMRNNRTLQKTRTVPRILFMAEDVTLAHVTRPLVLANSLNRNEYEIFFATGETHVSLVESNGYPCHRIQVLSSLVFLDRLSKGRPVHTSKELRDSVKNDLELIKQLSPDLVVGDFRLSLGISAELSGTPYVALTNAHWSPYSTQPFPLPEHPLVNIFEVNISRLLLRFIRSLLFKYHALAFNSVRRSYGLSPVGNLRNVYTKGDWTLYLDIPRLAPTSGFPSNHIYIGPVLWSPNIPLPEWWDQIPADKPTLYVTMGSSGEVAFMNMLFDELGKMPLTAMVATANRFEAGYVSKNIFFAQYLPGIEAARRSDLVLCNGGSATVYQALACGSPVLGFPSNADQYLTMESVAKHGAGLLIRSGKVNRHKLRTAIEDLLSNKNYHKASVQMKEEILGYHAPSRFSAFISSLWEK